QRNDAIGAKGRRRVLTRAAAVDLSPALDVDEDLTAARRESTVSDAPPAADPDAIGAVLVLLHDAGQLDHRALVQLDLVDQFLRTVHAQVHAFGDVVVAAGFVPRPRADREDVALRAAG